MLLVHGDVASIDQSLPWYIVELRSEKTMEGTIKRMGTKLADIFGDSPVEILIPITKRDLNQFDLKTGNYLFARSPNFAALLKLKKVTGVIGLGTTGDSNRPAHAIKIENEFVQEMIADLKKSFLSLSEGINPGSFVRIIDGDMRDMCGTVVSVQDGVACVRIEIKTKEILVETPSRNLLNLSHIPNHLRVFYYSPLVQELADSGEAFMVREDVSFSEDPRYGDDGLTAKKAKQIGRQQTITARIRRLIHSGTVDPLEIAAQVMRALKLEELRPPKTLSILHGVIKEHLILDYFAPMDPSIKNYREVVTKYGDKWKFSIQEIRDIDPDLDIPMKSGSEEI